MGHERSESDRDLTWLPMRGPWYSLSSLRGHRAQDAGSLHVDLFTGVETRDKGLYLALGLATLLAFARLIDITETGPAALLLLTLIGTSGVLCALFRPTWYPALVIAYLPFSMQYPFVIGMGINLTNVLLLFGILAIISHRGQNYRRHRFGTFEVLLLIMLVFGFVGFLRAYAVTRELGLSYSLTIFKRWASPILFFFVIRSLLEGRRDMARLLTVIVWTTFLAALLTWWVAIERGPRGSIDESRIAGIFNGPNEMGTFLVYASMPMLALFVSRVSWVRRMLNLGGFLIAARAMLFTFSRGAYVSLIAGTTIVLLLRNPLYLIGAAVLGTAALIVEPGLIPDSVLQRMGQTADESIYEGVDPNALDESVSHRFVLWRAAAGVIRDYPMTGVGLDRFPWYVDAYVERPLGASEPRDAHNVYLRIAAELGIPALLVLLALLAILYVTTLRLNLRRKHPFDRFAALAALGSLTALIVTFMFGSRFNDENFIGHFWAMAAMVMVLRHLPDFKPASGVKK